MDCTRGKKKLTYDHRCTNNSVDACMLNFDKCHKVPFPTTTPSQLRVIAWCLFFFRGEQKYVSCGPFEQVQDSSRSEIANPVGETTTDGQKQNWQVAFPS